MPPSFITRCTSKIAPPVPCGSWGLVFCLASRIGKDEFRLCTRSADCIAEVEDLAFACDLIKCACNVASRVCIGGCVVDYFFYFVQHSRALQPRPLPSVHKLANGGKTSVLLVVAHPDDESMFFGPTLLSLAQLDIYNIHALCFSTGNADGLGNVRKSEMATACSVLKVPTENVDVVDHPALQDGFSSLWDHSLIVKLVRQTVADHHIQVVLTFDNYGISGHPNHRAVHSGVREFLLEEGKSTKGKGGSVEEVVRGWELVSTNILRKYSGPLELCAPLLNHFFSHEDIVHHLANPSPWTSIVAMRRHKSQWVWYRRLFVLFSRYTYINTLRKMPG